MLCARRPSGVPAGGRGHRGCRCQSFPCGLTIPTLGGSSISLSYAAEDDRRRAWRRRRRRPEWQPARDPRALSRDHSGNPDRPELHRPAAAAVPVIAAGGRRM